jgi:hypothetical protein
MRIFPLKKIRNLLFLFIVFTSSSLFGQDTASTRIDTLKQVDVTDILRNIFNRPEPKPKARSKVNFAILPTLSYNPSFGFIFGG